MKQVGLSAAPSDAVNEVQAVAHMVLEKNGGQGCVREFIDRVFTKQHRNRH